MSTEKHDILTSLGKNAGKISGKIQTEAIEFIDAAKKEKHLTSIVSYLTILGWVIAYFGMSHEKTVLEKHHMRQALGLHLMMITIQIIQITFGILGSLYGLIMIIYLIMIVIYAIRARRGIKVLIPGIGAKFETWFAHI